MKFEAKISGTSVTDFDIDPIFKSQLITLAECLEKIHRQETMNWILDTLRFTKGQENDWFATIDWDSITKLTILEKYPEYEAELIDYFGEGWMKHYIRFGH